MVHSQSNTAQFEGGLHTQDINSRYGLTKDKLSTFRRDSIVNLGVLFDADEVSAVVAEFSALLQSPVANVKVIGESGSNEARSVMGWENATLRLREFATDIRVLGPVQSVLGEDVVFHQTKYNPKAAHGKGEKWDPHRGITFWHYLDGVPDPEGMVSVFIALTDQTKENGATYTWLGAHDMTIEDLRDETDFSNRDNASNNDDTSADLSLQIRPEKIAQYDEKYEKIDLVGPAGTVWLLDSRNLHASQPNRSEAVRILVANVFRKVSNVPLHPRNEQALCATLDNSIVPFHRPNV
ncbi:phytanoyl-CoA dioxygenase family protein [Sphingomonas sp. LB2R24]